MKEETRESSTDERFEKILAILEKQTNANDSNKTGGVENKSASDRKRSWDEVKCFHCGQKGHGFPRCRNAMKAGKKPLYAFAYLNLWLNIELRKEKHHIL